VTKLEAAAFLYAFAVGYFANRLYHFLKGWMLR
jgi:hypothetical protein